MKDIKTSVSTVKESKLINNYNLQSIQLHNTIPFPGPADLPGLKGSTEDNQ